MLAVDDAAYSQGALVKLRVAVQAHFDRAMARQGEAMQCKAGCSSCCKGGLTVFGIEASKIQGALQELGKSAPALRKTVRRQGQRALADAQSNDTCPLLVDDRCTVYEQRPLICRSHGLPILSEESTEPRNCELNFQDQAPEPTTILRLEAVNLPLSVGAQLWQKATQTPLRVSLATLAAEDHKSHGEKPST